MEVGNLLMKMKLCGNGFLVYDVIGGTPTTAKSL
jgi:hypothetical protein